MRSKKMGLRCKGEGEKSGKKCVKGKGLKDMAKTQCSRRRPEVLMAGQRRAWRCVKGAGESGQGGKINKKRETGHMPKGRKKNMGGTTTRSKTLKKDGTYKAKRETAF